MNQFENNQIRNFQELSPASKTALPFLVAMVAATVSATAIAPAAPLNIGQEQVQFQELELTPDIDLGGRSVQASSSVSEVPKFYFAPGLNVMSPTVITVLVDDPGRPAKVSLHRHFWNEADFEAETDADGTWTFTGRIDDSVGIALSAEETTDVMIMIWSGDVILPAVPPVLFDSGRPIEPAQDQ